MLPVLLASFPLGNPPLPLRDSLAAHHTTPDASPTPQPPPPHYTLRWYHILLLPYLIGALILTGYADSFPHWLFMLAYYSILILPMLIATYPWHIPIIFLFAAGYFVVREGKKVQSGDCAIYSTGIALSDGSTRRVWVALDDMRDVTVRGPDTIRAAQTTVGQRLWDEIMDGHRLDESMMYTVKLRREDWVWRNGGWPVVIRFRDRRKPVVLRVMGMAGTQIVNCIVAAKEGRTFRIVEGEDGCVSVVVDPAGEKEVGEGGASQTAIAVTQVDDLFGRSDNGTNVVGTGDPANMV
ncbi:hypothetical protein HK104_004612 [Borealophlyctis nickersoniae]|nr:hypothetical protein HK104_004612 [Borealophlyctis nickersoniae]